VENQKNLYARTSAPEDAFPKTTLIHVYPLWG